MNKLDLLLKLSYDRAQKKGIFIPASELRENGIYLSSHELRNMLELLKNNRLAVSNVSGTGFRITLTAEGIRFCEHDSFSIPGTPVIRLRKTA
ncbi:MAG: hypothetical protein JKY09_06595 [Crocinitomicaceae bacterium]|nr:hypothetical protein [Crocinitomicaceae bacterium]